MSRLHLLILAFVAILPYLTQGSNMGCKCSEPLGKGTAARGDPYWLQTIKHQGLSAFNPDPSSYQVFRNVKDFGATGDGSTDDTAAINAAMSVGDRCGNGTCAGSTITPAVVYFPPGTYLVSSAIPAYYYTEIFGDARNPPTVLASSNFTGFAVIDADPFPNGGGAQWYVNQNNFFRSVKNLVIDTTQMPATAPAIGLHWQVSQATSLYNVVFNCSTASGNTHRGLFMENGSGGFMGDLVFNGGSVAMDVGNQQFTVRNLVVTNSGTAVRAPWNWGWNFQNVKITNCEVGFNVTVGTKNATVQGLESEVIMDACVEDTGIFYQSSQAVTELQGSIVLNNIKLTNVSVAVGVLDGATVLAGGTTTVDSWVQGNVYTGTSPTLEYTVGNVPSVPKASRLLDKSGRMYGRGRPLYADYSIDQVISVKDYGAKGDGFTDDTAALQAIFDDYAGCRIIFFDAGTYIVTSTLMIPTGVHIFGEVWAVIMGSGPVFGNQSNPTVVVQVGEPGSRGTVEIGGMIFSTRGPAPGAIVVEWNVKQTYQGSAGLWDSHIRLGGSAGSDMQSSQCPIASPGPNCYAAFLALHLTSGSSAYIEGAWIWLADHDIEGVDQITIYSGRGVLSESKGPVWLVGTAEHHVLYQYNLACATNHYMALPQTETPYYQPNPPPPAPFSPISFYHDPTQWDQAAWAFHVTESKDILVYGAGFYSFFQNYNLTCATTMNCQPQIVNIDPASSVNIYGMSTVGAVYQLSVDGTPVIPASSNLNGFAQTVTAWYPW